MTRSFALDERLAAFIDAQVRDGRYASPDEVIGDALRLLAERETLADLDVAELRRLSDEGLASGLAPDDGETIFDRLEARYQHMAGPAGR